MVLSMRPLAHKRILLGLTGGIACYKAAQLCRQLRQAGAQVQVVMTTGATQFITPLTLQALSGQPVYVSTWETNTADGMAHISLTRDMDAIVIAPASAHFLAQLAQGEADELLSLLCLGRPREKVPLILAPAMNKEMWSHPATQRNVVQLKADGTHVLDIASGLQACGETGEGRMLEPNEIQEALITALSPQILAGYQVLITAGPTYEAIDPVRGITNRSSGKMGFAFARVAQRLGARVTLVTGPVQLPIPPSITCVKVTSAKEMYAAVQAALIDAPFDIFLACAAVADWRPVHPSNEKIKKSTPSTFFSAQLNSEPQWVKNPDILAEVAQSPRAQSGQLFCVGFAAETENVISLAQEKRQTKKIPLMIANQGPTTFDQDTASVFLINDIGCHPLKNQNKEEIAFHVFIEIRSTLKTNTGVIGE
jgi:phosphopantothenoylcysteine decarboxylase/phosphopantothenate--cysteine ligase